MSAAPLGSFDAQEWTTYWLGIIKEHPGVPHDPEAMLGWFANVLMSGYEYHIKEGVQGESRVSLSNARFGRRYRDKITGFVGVCTGVSASLSGSPQVFLEPHSGPEGAFREGQWFEEDRLEEVPLESSLGKFLEHT